MKYDEFTNAELDTLLSATCKIKEIFLGLDTFEELIGDEEFSTIVKIQILTFNKIKERHQKRIERLEQSITK